MKTIVTETTIVKNTTATKATMPFLTQNLAGQLFAVLCGMAMLSLLAACGTSREPRPEDLVGRDAEDVRRCIGTAAQEQQLGTRTLWTYQVPVGRQAREYTRKRPPQDITGKSGAWTEDSCVLHVELRAGRVTDVSYYRAESGQPGDRDRRCAYVAGDCGR